MVSEKQLLDKTLETRCLVFGWVLAPFESGRSANLKIRTVRTEGGHAFRLTWPDGGNDLIFWRWEGTEDAEFGGYHTDTKGAIVRKKGRRVVYAGAIEGTYLEGRGVSLQGQGLVE